MSISSSTLLCVINNHPDQSFFKMGKTYRVFSTSNMNDTRHYIHDEFDFCKRLEISNGKLYCIVSSYNGRNLSHEVEFEEVSLV